MNDELKDQFEATYTKEDIVAIRKLMFRKKYGKKAIAIAVLAIYAIVMLVMVVMMTSCGGRLEEMGDMSVYTTEKANEMNAKIKDCVNNHNSEQLTALFSKRAKQKTEDLDSAARTFIDAFDGNEIVKIEGSEPGFGGTKDLPPLDVFGHYILTLSNDKQYDMWIFFCDYNNEDEKDVGLIQIQMCTCLKKDRPKDFRLKSLNRGYEGIYVYEF